MHDAIEQGEYDYFSFYMEGAAGMTIQFTLTPLSGDPDLFVSTTVDHPSRINNTWQSFRYGSDTITIETSRDTSDGTSDTSASSHSCVDCTYFIAVYGNDNSHYTLTGASQTLLTIFLVFRPKHTIYPLLIIFLIFRPKHY